MNAIGAQIAEKDSMQRNAMSLETRDDSSVTKEQLTYLDQSWLKLHGYTSSETISHESSDLLEQTFVNRLKTLLHHFFLQPNFDQTQFLTQIGEGQIDPILEAVKVILKDTNYTSINWLPKSSIGEIATVLGLGESSSDTPVNILESRLIPTISTLDQTMITGFL